MPQPLPSILDLGRLANVAAVVGPDYELLVLSDAVVMLARQRDEIEAVWRAPMPASRDDRRLYEEYRASMRALRGPLVRLGRMHAVTAAGIFAKAVAVRKAGSNQAAVLAKSLAEDLLNCADLREAIWPAADQRGSDG
jgi:hypothetical protein